MVCANWGYGGGRLSNRPDQFVPNWQSIERDVMTALGSTPDLPLPAADVALAPKTVVRQVQTNWKPKRAFAHMFRRLAGGAHLELVFGGEAIHVHGTECAQAWRHLDHRLDRP
jgi:hypothetical protein